MNVKHVLRFAFLFVLPLFVTMTAAAQTRTVTGTVVDDSTKAPIPGVTIKVKDGPQTAITNDQGSFTLNVPANGAVIQYSHINYEFGEIAVKLEGPMNISMKRMENSLDDVVVVGYGTQRARDITGSVVNVDLKKLTDMPVASITEALRGQIPGVNVTGGSTRPGAMPSLNIRQQFDWSKDGGTTNPLIIIDDVIQVDPATGASSMDRFNQLDLSEVESITVLRDASAAIYGSRASQGAVVVKTKRGKAGPPRISYNGKFETNNAVSHGKVMNAREFGTYSNRFGRALGWTVDQLFSDTELATMDSLNYDWLGNDWRAANAMQHSLDVSGGSERATYFAGGSYYTQGANLGSQDFSRWTYRAGTDIKVLNGLRLGATVAAANTNLEKSFTKVNITDGYAGGGGNEQNDYSILLHMPKYVPWVYNINGVDQYVSPPLGPHRLGNVSGNNSLSNWNYYALLNNGSKQSDENFNYNANFSLNYEIPFVKGLAVKFNYGLTQNSSKAEQVMMPMLLVRNGQGNKLNNHLFTDNTTWDAPVLNRSGSRVSYDNLTTKNQQTNFFITYDRKFGNHNLAAMGSVEKVVNGSEKRTQLWTNPAPGIYNGTSVSTLGTIDPQNSITYRNESGTLSYLGRLNYDFKSRYLLQFVFRTDASTRFAPANYWGFFPGVSAGWVISDENWFKDNVSWMNYLKVRASFARTGNDNVKPWKWLQLYGILPSTGMGFGSAGATSGGGTFAPGITPDASPNPDIRWDRTTQRNLGIDMGFLNRRLSLTLDAYYNTSSDVLTDLGGAINVPISVGGAFAEQNYSSFNFWGTEISATWKDNINDFSYSIGMNFGIGNNKITKYIDQPFSYPGIMERRRDVGNSTIFPAWGYRTWKGTSGGDGILRTDADIDNYWAYLTANANNSGIAGAAPRFFDVSNKSGLKKGMLVYEDVAGQLDANNKTVAGPNGVISEDGQDFVKLRSGMTYSINTNLSFQWKGISLMALLTTSWGGPTTLDYIKQGTGSTNAMWAPPIYLNDMYDSASNPNGRYPNIAYSDDFRGTNSDFFLLPSFRMFVRSLSIGYTLPKEWIEKARIANARVFVSGQNLWDFYNPYPNKYRNMYDDPRTPYPTLRTWALGVSLGF
jgi:TonB-linked SusC/RagA family outer membrane protein